jgi:branched-subunit amino acid transport protein AzlD
VVAAAVEVAVAAVVAIVTRHLPFGLFRQQTSFLIQD